MPEQDQVIPAAVGGTQEPKPEVDAEKAAQIAADQKRRAEIAEQKEADARKALEDAQATIKELTERGSSPEISEDELQKIADKYNVEIDAVKDLLKVATVLSTNAATSKIKPMLEERDRKEKEAKLEQEFDKAFGKIAKSDTYKGVKIDKDSVKTLQLANPNKTVKEIVDSLYGGVVVLEGKSSSEDEVRPAAQRGAGDTIDFDKLTDEQRTEVLKDPAMKQQYFKYRDQKGI